MNTRIERDFEFQAAVYFEDKFLMNTYTLSLSMLVATDSIREQNVAMDRMTCLLTECLESCVFIKSSEKKVIDKYVAAGLKVSTLPEEPYDQIISMLLLIKLNAITEKRLIITDARLTSKLSDGVSFCYDNEDVYGPFEEMGWWHESGTAISDLHKTQNKKDKIVKLVNKANDWAEYSLQWQEKSTKASEIVFLSDEK
jgi:phage gp46-like protein